MFERLRVESRGILKEIIQLVYFMRGSIQFNDMMEMTPPEREMVSEFIGDRLKQEQNKINPVY